ncbi:hypothetical protein BAZSYMA_ACONTIG167839_1 [Bathymodiolus azoricus thioautotrophic gill symbiont]|uniref:Uncharacterized protein n=1 Tax=Bathymodiolus azoricus thioautotrophic gill symbiont TaxID=235205 RepID=A0A1H6MQ61_9GAMM|nr:hypothetical protein BAZSYMA_ACONTIG167839_1 [Bathymodiolus azoricus thioautotrophic gill symbiont]
MSSTFCSWLDKCPIFPVGSLSPNFRFSKVFYVRLEK